MAGTGLVVKGGESYQKVVSSNPGAEQWMDILIVERIVMFVSKDKNKLKRGGVGPIFFFKKS